MSLLLFLNLLAYSGVGLVVLSLIYVGLLLLRPSSSTQGLAALVGQGRARECMRNGSLRTSQLRTVGTLFVVLGCFIAICIARDLRHA